MKLKLIRDKIAGQLEKPIKTSTACKFFIGGIAAALIYVNGLSLVGEIMEPTHIDDVNISIAQVQKDEETQIQRGNKNQIQKDEAVMNFETPSDSQEVVTNLETSSDTQEVVTDLETSSDTQEVVTNLEIPSDTQEAVATHGQSDNSFNENQDNSCSSNDKTKYEPNEIKVLEIRDYTNDTIKYVFMDNVNPVKVYTDDILSSNPSYDSFKSIFDGVDREYICRETSSVVYSEQYNTETEDTDVLRVLRIGYEYYITREYKKVLPRKDGTLDIQTKRTCYYYPNVIADPKNYVELDFSITERTLEHIVNINNISFDIDELKELENNLNSNNEIRYCADDICVASITDNASNTTKYFFMTLEDYENRFFTDEELMDMEPFKLRISTEPSELWGTVQTRSSSTTEYYKLRGIFKDNPCSYEITSLWLAGFDSANEPVGESIEVNILRCDTETYISEEYNYWKEYGQKKEYKIREDGAYYYPNYQGTDNPGKSSEVDVSFSYTWLSMMTHHGSYYTLSELKEMENQLNTYGHITEPKSRNLIKLK